MSRYSAADRAAIESRQVERVYSVLSRVYDGFFDWALGPGRRTAVERLGARPGERVLEVGVGTGLSLPLYPRHCLVTGIDISEPMLERARQRADAMDVSTADLQVMDARDLQFEDATFDRVLAPYVISVIPDPERAIAEIRRVCKPGGTVIVVNHFHSSNAILRTLERWATPLTRWIGFRLDQPIDVVRAAAGLEIIDVEPVNIFGMWSLLEMRRR